MPLAQRALRIPDNAQALKATGIMAAAIGAAAFGVMPAAVAFAIGLYRIWATLGPVWANVAGGAAAGHAPGYGRGAPAGDEHVYDEDM